MPTEKEMTDKDISLKITILQQDGTPYPGTVDIEFQHQTLADRYELHSADGSKAINVAGLHRAPQGLYKVTVTSTAFFAPTNQFVTVPASGFATVTFKLEHGEDIVMEPPHLKERANFRSLILTNPNYFGNIAKSPYKPVINISGNTFYEEIGCVGFEPQLSLLEAVVYIKQITGYAGGVCSNGSKEYVRFYLSFDDGATWQDQGEVDFTVYDVPAEPRRKQRLEYACTLKINPPKKPCKQRNILRARAILSWNVPNPPATPNHTPVWGNAHDTYIQVAKLQSYRVKDVFEVAELKIPPMVMELIDVETPVIPLPPPKLSALDLQALYKEKKVEPHRFALKEAIAYMDQPGLTAKLMAPDYKLPFPTLDPGEIFGPIAAPPSDTRYEELVCIGHHSGDHGLLAGIVRVKLPCGYSGGPCTDGSLEYVTFWADFDNSGNFATCLGQTSVRVYDFENLPEGGLEYAVYLPVNFDQYRQECHEGPKVVHIRAILSWNVLPPCGQPNYRPVWGNRLETMILLQPGLPVTTQVPLLSRAGDMSYINISAGGLATGNTLETGALYHDSPFGGVINIAGKIPLPTSGMKYRVMKKLNSDPATAWAPIVNEPQGVGLYISTWNPVTGWHTTYTVKHALPPTIDGYYEYEDYASYHYVESNLMGYWQTTAADDGKLFNLRIDLNVDGNPDHDLHSNVVSVLIDNTAPVALLSIDLGGQCGDFTPGAIFTGKFTATDIHFGSFSFDIKPDGPPAYPSHGVLPVPPSGASVLYGGAIGDPGLANATWTVNTGRTPPAGEPHVGPMDPCGYAIILHVWDRTNVNNGRTSNYAQASVGFCLRKP